MPESVPARPALPVQEVNVALRPMARLEPLIGSSRYRDLREAADVCSRLLGGKRVWNVSSTAAGGGVAEMLPVLIGYILDARIDIRWLVITGDADFFAITKRLHNRLHGVAGDSGELGRREQAHYHAVTAANARTALQGIRPGDVVVLHDPQTAGLAGPLTAAGARVIWRCHIGRETTNEWTDEAWSFLRGDIAACEACVFSVRAYIPAWMDESTTWVIPPSIDPFAPKNQEMTPEEVTLTLRGIGLLKGTDRDPIRSFTRRDGTPGFVTHPASILSVDIAPLEAGLPLVVQVSRWDRLKDMIGVMQGFTSFVAPRIDAHLALVGPSAGDVTDDPEGREVFAECASAWSALPFDLRRRVSLVSLPMDDIEENAIMVNAIQRSATVIVQKSLAEGFGLTVAEGMWKSKAVVASRVGGITQQIAPGTGVLLDDPADLATFGDAVATLLERPEERARIGLQTRQHVLAEFVGDLHLLRYARLIEHIVGS